MTILNIPNSSNDIMETSKFQKETESDRVTPSGFEGDHSNKENLHFVSRNEPLSGTYGLQEGITGFVPSLMAARAVLSRDEERKLLHKIDYRLIPLLSLLYMVKTIDAANVRDIPNTCIVAVGCISLIDVS